MAIVALGPSKYEYLEALTRHEGLDFDEIWTVNTGIRYVPADLAFVMDDLRWFATRHPAYGRDLIETAIPIISNTAYEEFGRVFAYPLAEVLAWTDPSPKYFHHNSIPFVLAYAGMIGVEDLTLFGVDYSHPQAERVEAGREVATYWLGLLAGRGVKLSIASSSTLLQTDRRVSDPDFRHFYGYLFQPIVSR